MLWIFLSVGTAFFSASEAALTRHGFQHASPSSAVVAPLVFSLPLFALTLPFLETPQLQPGFWSVLALLVPINAAGYYLQNWSFKSSPLSLTVPFMAFTPVFVLGTGFLYLGERPSAWGCLGVLVTVVGGYMLYADEKGGVLAPFRAILRERGSMLMLAAALVWSVASVMGKQLILLSSPIYAGCVFSLAHNAALLLFLLLIGQVAAQGATATHPASARARAVPVSAHHLPFRRRIHDHGGLHALHQTSERALRPGLRALPLRPALAPPPPVRHGLDDGRSGHHRRHGLRRGEMPGQNVQSISSICVKKSPRSKAG